MSDNELNNSAPPPSKDATLNNLYELMCEVAGHLITRDKKEQSWRAAKRLAIGALVGGFMVTWAMLYAPMLGWSSDPTEASVGVVPIQGEIGGAHADADAVVPAIERACSSRLTKVVILRISSPGGSPTDAERISESIRDCRLAGGTSGSKPDSAGKKVIAVIEGVGASAAYLIAVHADEVHAGRYAPVGSIGAVMRTWDMSDAARKHGVAERVFASGKLKAGNSPFSANTPEQDALSQSLVDTIAQMFIAEVRERRGSKLKETPDMFSGRVWVGPEAVRLGLIDSNSTYEGVLRARFKDLPVHEFRPTQTFQDRLGLSALAREFGVGLTQGMSGTRFE